MKTSEYIKKSTIILTGLHTRNDELYSFCCCCRCGSQKVDDKPHSMDTTKIQQLGFPAFKPIPQMFDDCIKSFQEKGFL